MLQSSRLLTFGRLISARSYSVKAGDLTGKVAIVTAGTDGIGLEIAKRLGQNGAHVVVSSRKQENVDRAIAEMKGLGLKVSGTTCHFGKQLDRKKLLEMTMQEQGAINILVQNAGVNPQPYNIMETPESAIDKTYEIHIKSNFQMVQEIVPYMEKSKKQGSIILTSSITAYIAHIYPGIYAITKSAVNTMTRAFMPELLKSNIRINCMTIGGMETTFLKEAMNMQTHARKELTKHVPMGRFGEPEECAGLAALLASDDSSYITGESFNVAGGVYARP